MTEAAETPIAIHASTDGAPAMAAIFAHDTHRGVGGLGDHEVALFLPAELKRRREATGRKRPPRLVAERGGMPAAHAHAVQFRGRSPTAAP